MTVRLTFLRVPERHADGDINRRYHKVRYTAALRLGFIPEAQIDGIEVGFVGELARDVTPHEGRTAFRGELRFVDRSFTEVVVIGQVRRNGRYELVTFWPELQHPDAHESCTDPLVDAAMDDHPFDIVVVATIMHAAYVENPSVSPATLMMKLHQSDLSLLRDAAERLGQLLKESHQREKLLADRVHELESKLSQDQSRPETNQASSSPDDVLAEDMSTKLRQLESLQRNSALVPDRPIRITPSNVAVLLRVEEGRRGRDNQRAILLHMSDGTVRANNWSGGYQARLSYARNLVGERIRTDVWGDYPWEQWFKNVYPVDE